MVKNSEPETERKPIALPPGWVEVPLRDLGLGRTEGIEPADEPTTLFELWSVPSFPTGKPERVLGSTVGSNKQRVAEGDVLLCKINPRINRVWVVGPSSGLPQIASTEWIVFRSSAFEPRFLMWRFRENRFRGALCANMTGVGGSLTRARPKDVAEIRIALPPLAEQRRIVARLESLEARSRRARALLAEVPAQLAQARQSLLAAAFRGDLTAEWRSANNCAPPEMCRLGDVANVVSGFAFKSNDYAKEGIPLLRISNLATNGVDLDGCVFIPPAKANWKFAVRNGDILIALSGATTGKFGVYRSEAQCLLNQRVGNLRMIDHERLSPNFRNYALELLKPQIEETAYGGAQPNIAPHQIEGFSIWLPALPEQNEIVRRLEAALARLDAAARAHAAAVAELDRLDQSLLARAFSGTLVPHDPADVLLGPPDTEPSADTSRTSEAARRTLSDSKKCRNSQ